MRRLRIAGSARLPAEVTTAAAHCALTIGALAFDDLKDSSCPMPSAFTTGGPEVLQLGRSRRRRARARAKRACATPRSASTTSTPIIAAASTSCRCRRASAPKPRASSRRSAPGVDWVKAGDRVAYCGGPLGAYSEVRVMPADRLVKLPDGIADRSRGDADAEGPDGAVPVPPDVPAQGGRDDPVPRRGGRRRPHRLPMGARARRDDDRHRRLRREGRAREGERLHAHDRLHARELRRARQGSSPAARACRSSTTASARTRFRPRSTACRRAACS